MIDFFEHQERARRRTGRLVLLFAAAVLAIIALVDLAVGVALIVAGVGSGPDPTAILLDPVLLGGVTLATLAVVGIGCLSKMMALRGGGSVVAEALGGRPVLPGKADRTERRLLNVVEEMAIASGTPTPRVYLLADEPGINAFAAGYSTDDAVVAVTRGTAERLTRDELQGVVAHEFSHILNGDMRLNVRLIGILNGILVLGILGSYVLRSLRFTRRTSSRDGGGAVILGIVLVGVALVAIGSIGTFFGNLIKAGVSRQREFLADASAVQFTRTPSGIAGALKKIGGLSIGSMLRSPRAPEASHLFFGQGVRFLLGPLFATHPPLAERIRRIDPSWDGTFPKLPDAAPAAADARAAAFAPRDRYPSEPVRAAATAGVGRPTPAHLDYAAGILETLPPIVAEAVREPYGARAVIYTLLLNTDRLPRRRQLRHLARHTDEGERRETARLLPLVEDLDDALRLPLVDLALPALRALTPAQYEAFDRNVRVLVDADETIDLFEWYLQRVLRRHLAPQYRPIRPPRVRYYALSALRPQCGVVLATLARAGQDEDAAIRRAYEAGWSVLGLDPVALADRAAAIDLHSLDAALDDLRTVAPRLARTVLAACAACVTADGTARIQEVELLRAIADTLGYPMPPVLAPASP